jgi:hypothetical protein
MVGLPIGGLASGTLLLVQAFSYRRRGSKWEHFDVIAAAATWEFAEACLL